MDLNALLTKRNEFEMAFAPIISRLYRLDMKCAKFKKIDPLSFHEPPVRILFAGKTRSGKSRLVSSLLAGSRGKKNNLHLCLCPDRGNDSFTNCIWRVRKGTNDGPSTRYRFILVGNVSIVAPQKNQKEKLSDRKELKVLQTVRAYINVDYVSSLSMKESKITKDIYDENKNVLAVDFATSRPGMVSECIAYALRGEEYPKKGWKNLFKKIQEFLEKIQERNHQSSSKLQFSFSEVIIEHPLTAFQHYEFIDCAGSGEIKKYNSVMRREVKNAHFVVYVTCVSNSGGIGMGVTDELLRLKSDDETKVLLSEKMIMVGSHIDKRLGDVPAVNDDDEEEEGEDEMSIDEVNEKLEHIKMEMRGKMQNRAVTVPIFLVCSVLNRSQRYGEVYGERFNILKNYLRKQFTRIMFTDPCTKLLEGIYKEIFRCCKILRTDVNILVYNEKLEIDFIRGYCKNSIKEIKKLSKNLEKYFVQKEVVEGIKDLVCEEEIDSEAVNEEIEARQIIIDRIISGFEIFSEPWVQQAKANMNRVDDRYSEFDFDNTIVDLSYYDYMVLFVQNLGFVKDFVLFLLGNKSVWREIFKGDGYFQSTRMWREKAFCSIFPKFQKRFPGFISDYFTKIFSNYLQERKNECLKKKDILLDQKNANALFKEIISVEANVVVQEFKFLNTKSLVLEKKMGTFLHKGTNHDIYEAVVLDSVKKKKTEEVAVKIENVTKGDGKFTESSTEIFCREIHNLNSIRLHCKEEREFSNLMHLVYLGRVEKKFRLALPFVQSNLRQIIRSNDITEGQKLLILRKIANALRYLHLNGIHHGNLQPKKVLVNLQKREVVVCGFDYDVLSNTNKGEYLYKDPLIHFEVNNRVGLKYDIYSLGMIMAELWEGKFLIKGKILDVYNGDNIEERKRILYKMIRRKSVLRDVKIVEDLKWGSLQKVTDELNQLVRACTCLDERKRCDIFYVVKRLMFITKMLHRQTCKSVMLNTSTEEFEKFRQSLRMHKDSKN